MTLDRDLRLLLIGVGVIIALAALVGLQAGRSAANREPPPRTGAASWALPPLPPNTTVADAQLVTLRPLWQPKGPAAGAATAAAAVPRTGWRLAGLALGPKESFALVFRFDTNKTEIVRAGESLPDGATLKTIDSAGILVAGETGERRIGMFEPPKTQP
jgi:hypothetical protein